MGGCGTFSKRILADAADLKEMNGIERVKEMGMSLSDAIFQMGMTLPISQLALGLNLRCSKTYITITTSSSGRFTVLVKAATHFVLIGGMR